MLRCSYACYINQLIEKIRPLCLSFKPITKKPSSLSIVVLWSTGMLMVIVCDRVDAAPSCPNRCVQRALVYR